MRVAAQELTGVVHHPEDGIPEMRPCFDFLDELPGERTRSDDEHPLAAEPVPEEAIRDRPQRDEQPARDRQAHEDGRVDAREERVKSDRQD